jgi:hypothetical protein
MFQREEIIAALPSFERGMFIAVFRGSRGGTAIV